MNNKLDNNQETLFSAVKNLVGELMGVCFLFVLFVPILVAPMFGYYVRGNLMATYGIYNENNDVIKAKMLPVWAFLWVVALIGWSIIGYIEIDIQSVCNYTK